MQPVNDTDTVGCLTAKNSTYKNYVLSTTITQCNKLQVIRTCKEE